MALKHTNPSSPRRDRDGRTYSAHAPYNFVPLPDALVPAPPELPPHDRYSAGLLTGRIECELETRSPLYIRGGLTPADFKTFGEKGPDELTVDEKLRRASFFATGETLIEGRPQPVIPGSSLRGMVRSLVEIIGFGRVRWVGREPTFTFRAVAAASNDPLREPYRSVIGAFSRNVSAGYLVRRGDEWLVQPALTPKQMGWPSEEAFLKVKERSINGRDLPAYIRLDDPNYRPQIHAVRFNVEIRRSQRGSFAAVTQMVARKGTNVQEAISKTSDAKDPALQYEGRLVCSGNMKEAAKDKQDRPSPRRSHTLVLMPDPKARTLKIRRQAIEDYKAGLTDYQKEKLTDWSGKRCAEMGCLGDLKPVFYVAEGDEVVYFGHSPNFRIPARLVGADRAATPPDFVPDPLRRDPRPDLADALFGWVKEAEGPQAQRAGRVSFGDARFIGAEQGVWLQPEPIIPRTLSGPKATTFQHYLVQDRRAGHDPDKKETLAHYGSPPNTTQLRGHKLYWHRGKTPDLEASAKEREHENQLTRIVPLRPGVRFKFTLRFENLRPEELGALWWALALPGEPGKDYCHKLGMGKPLGMGAVKLTPKLVLEERRGAEGRYGQVFTSAGWQEAERQADGATYAQQFEAYVLQTARLPGAGKLANVERIRMLLAMLEWRDGTEEWLSTTSYMLVEAGANGKINEYKERPVLPDPLAVLAGQPVAGAAPLPREERTTPSSSTLRPQPAGISPTPPVKRDSARTGKVTRWNADRAYGFILPDGGQEREVFVHITAVAGNQALQVEQRVSFETEQGPKGLQAKNVRPVS